MAAGGGQQADSSNDLIWGGLLIVIIIGAVGYFYHRELVAFALSFKYYEAKALNLVLGVLKPEIAFMKGVDPAQISFSAVAAISESVGNYWRYPVCLLLVGLAYWVYRSNPISNYKNTYSMKTLALAEASNWPQITPVLAHDLVSTDIMKGPWAMSRSPMEFAEHHDLLDIHAPDPSAFGEQLPTVTVREDKAREVFYRQMGKPFTTIDAMPIHAKALLAVFAARMNRDADGAMNLIRQMAATSNQPKIDFSGYEELLNRYKDSSAVKRVISRHGFILTVMASMLLGAREDGVVASSDFLWLKPLDRPLWYMLNTIGRKTPFTEVGGAFAHWAAERKLGQAIKSPMVEEAVKGLVIGVSEIKYVPKDE